MTPPRQPTAERNHASTHNELIVRFALWANDLGALPTPLQIQDRFQVSRATSYRWLRSYCDAIGVEAFPPPKPTHRLAATGSAYLHRYEARP